MVLVIAAVVEKLLLCGKYNKSLCTCKIKKEFIVRAEGGCAFLSGGGGMQN